MKILKYILSLFTWVYVMYSPDFPRKFKIGWSGNCSRRRGEIQRELSEETGRKIRVWCCWKSPVLFAKNREKLLHRIYGRLKCNDMPRHSGWQEWFTVFNIVTALIVLSLGWYFHGIRFGLLYAAIFLLIELPLDAIFLCATLTAIEFFVLYYIAKFALLAYSVS